MSMTDYLVIRIPADLNEEYSWIVVNDEGTRLSGVTNGPLVDAIGMAAERKVIALLPGPDAFLAHVKLPVRSQAKLLQAVPFALEEQLADDVDDMHFALGRRTEDGSTPVAAVNRRLLEGFIDTLADSGIEADQIIADTQGVPHMPGAFTILMDSNRIYIADRQGERMVVQSDDLEEIVDSLGLFETQDEDDSVTASHLTAYLSEEDHRRFGDYLESLRDRIDSLDIKLLPDGPLPHLAVTVASGTSINLLQGKYAATTDVSLLWRPWRTAAALLGAFFLVLMIVTAVELSHLKTQEKQLDANMQSLFKETFPEARRPKDPAREFTKLAGTMAGGGPTNDEFITTLGTLGKVMANTDDARIDALNFRSGKMDIRVTVSSTETLEKIKTEVSEAAGLMADIQAVNRRGDNWEGRIQITEQTQ